MITPTDIKTRFIEFENLTDELIAMLIDEAVIIINEAIWADKYDLGLTYFVGHELAMQALTAAGQTSMTGDISSRSVSGVSVGYNNVGYAEGTDSYYSTTIYGRKYLQLRSTLSTGVLVV
jgi:hypothetical protein